MGKILNFLFRSKLIKSTIYTLIKKIRFLEDSYVLGDPSTIPKYDLKSKHLKSCQVVPDRISLLSLIPKGGIVAELGVASGTFSKNILEINQPSKLHLVDTWKKNTQYSDLETEVLSLFKNQIESGQVEINKGNSVEVLNRFNDGYFDWIYIDTVHDYLTTKEELRLSAIKVKQNGLICGDDYTSRSNMYGTKYGVIEAVHEFCVENNWEIIMLTTQVNGHNNFALKKIKS